MNLAADGARRVLPALGHLPVRMIARLFTGSRGGQIITAVLRDATHLSGLGYVHLRWHDLRALRAHLDG